MPFAGAGDNDVTITLGAVDNMSGVLRTAEQSIIAFSGSAERAVGSIGRLSAVLGPVAAIAAGFVAAGAAATSVQQQVANLNAVMRATPQQLQQIRNVGLQISQDSQFTERKIIEGQRLLAKSGADTIAILQQTRSIVNLGAATQTDPGQAAQAYIAAQKVFRQGVDDSTKTVDILAEAVDSSVGTLADYQVAFKQLGPVAESAGMNLRSTSTAITDLMNAGLRGDTGTAIKTFLTRIEHETPAAAKVVHDLGLEFFDTSGRMKSMADIADELRSKTVGLTQEQKNAALTQIFGTRGVRVADIYSEEGSRGITDAAQHMADIGSASDIAAEKLDTVQGSFHKLGSSINVFGVQAGQSALPAIKSITDALEGLANRSTTLGNAAPIVPQLFTGAALTGAAGLLVSRLQTAQQQRAAKAAEDAAAVTARSPAAIAQAAALRENEQFITKEINLQQELRNARIQANEANVSIGSAVQQQELKVVGLEKELDLLRTKGAVEAQIFAAESAAATAGSVRMNATLTALKEQEEIAKRQIMARNLVGAPVGTLPANVAAHQAEQGFLGSGGDLVGLEAYRRDLAAYEAEVARLNQTGLKITKLKFNPPDIKDYEQQVQSALIPALTQGPIQIPTAVTPVPGAITPATGAFKTAVSGAMGKIGSTLGEIAMPLLMAVTVKQLIFDPIVDALVKKTVGDHYSNQQATVALDISFAGQGGQTVKDFQTQLSEVNRIIDESQKSVDKYKKELEGASPSLGPLTGGSRISKEGDIITPGEMERYKQAQQTLDQALAARTQIQERQKNDPSIFKQDEITRVQDLGEAVASGKLTLDQATDQWQHYTEQIDRNTFATRNEIEVAKDHGLTQEQANALDKDGTAILAAKNQARLDEIATLKAAQEAYQDQYEQNVRQMDQARAMGVPDKTISTGIFGVTPEGIAATKEEVRIAGEEIKRYSDAWNTANAAIQKVDATKGIAGLVSMARDLSQANEALKSVGQSNEGLQSVSLLADRFKAVADAETAASAAMDGYNLTLTETDRRMKEIGTLRSGFIDALNAAQQRQLKGMSSAADDTLIANRDKYLGKLDNQTEELSKNASKDWIGKLDNLPDLKSADDYMRDMVDISGGGKNVMMKITADATAAQDEINRIIKGPWETSIKVNVSYAYPGGAPAGPWAPWDNSVNEVGEPNDPNRGSTPPGGGVPGGTGPQPAGALSNPNVGTAGFNMYQKQSYGQYQGIVPSNSPLSGQDNYTMLQEVAQRYNIDPDFLLSFMRQEGNFATDQGAGAWQREAHNPGGLKFANQQGAMKGPISTEGDNYASFSNYGDYFNAMAQTISAYDAFRKGNAAETVGAWTKGAQGYAGLPLDQQISVANSKLDYYRTYRGTGPDYNAPASGGIGQGSGEPQGLAVDAALSVGNALSTMVAGSNKGSDSSIFSTAKQHINQQKDRFQNDVYGWCLEIVDDIMQESGFDERAKHPEFSNTADQRVRAALAGMPGAGTVISQAQARAGDLVGWTSDSAYAGDPRGHIGIYSGMSESGQGKYIGTTTAGVQERPLGPGAIFIRPDGVVAGGPEPGTSVRTYTPQQIANSEHLTTTTSSGVPQRQIGNAPPGAITQPWQPDVTAAMNKLATALVGFNGEDIAKGAQTFQEIVPILTKTIGYQRFGTAGPLTTTDKQQVEGAAINQGLATQTAFTQGLDIIRKGTGDVAQVFQQINESAGPVAPMLTQQLSILQNIDRVTKEQVKDKQALLDGEARHTQLLKDRQAEDTAEQKRSFMEQYDDAATKRADDERYTRQQWQTADDRRNKTRAAEDQKTTLNDAWTIRSRQLEDEGRLIDFNGTLAKKNLQDQLRDAQKAERETRSYFAAQEQMLSGSVAGAGSRDSKNQLKEQLAITKDFDRQSQEGSKKNLDNISQLIQDQDILVSKERYDYETKKLNETRSHEDAIQAIDKEQARRQRMWEDDDTRDQRAKANADWRAADTAALAGLHHQQDIWNLAEKRQKEDEEYNAWHEGMQTRITAEGEIIKQGNDDLTVVKGLIAQWEYLFPIVGDTANQIFQGAKNIGTATGKLPPLPTLPYNTAVAGLKTDVGVPYSQFPEPGAGRGGYAGGTESAASGVHEVGEGGGIELIFRGGEKVVNASTIRSALGIGNSYAQPAPAVNVNTTLSFDSGMKTIFDNVALAEIEAVVARQTQRAMGQRQSSGIATASALGLRSAG